MEGLWLDLRYVCRRLARAPGFAAIATLVLAIGIGGNAFVFSIVHSFILRPIYIPRADSLVGIVTTRNGAIVRDSLVTDRELDGILDHEFSTVHSIFGVNQRSVSFGDRNATDVVFAEAVTANYFDAVGVQPLMGRLLVHDDFRTGAAGAVMISERFWRGTTHSDPTVMGRAWSLSGRQVHVVGIVPDAFHGLSYPNTLGVDVWVPIEAVREVVAERNGAVYLRMFARLNDRTTLPQARAEIGTIGHTVDLGYQPGGLAIQPASAIVEPSEFRALARVIGVAMALVSAVVLLITCANLAGIAVARTAARHAETSTRLALGASPWRILRLHLIEVVLLAATAGAVAMLLVLLLTHMLGTSQLPAIDGLRFHYRPTSGGLLAAYVCAAVVAVSALIGAGPATAGTIRSTRTLLLSAGSGGAGAQSAGYRTRLVFVQVAASTALAIIAALYVRGAVESASSEASFNKRDVAVGHFDFSLQRLSEGDGRAAYQRVLETVSAMPDVRRAALVSDLPGSGGTIRRVHPDEASTKLFATGVESEILIASPTLFDVLHIPVLRGRGLTDVDIATSPLVVVVTMSLAKSLWPSSDPVGHRLRVLDRTPITAEVVGVVPDIGGHKTDVGGRALFLSSEQKYSPHLAVLAAARSDPEQLVVQMRDVLRTRLPDLALFGVRTVAAELGLVTSTLTMAASALSVLAGLGLSVAVVGLYGVVAFLVALRLREFGIRKALGASTWQICQPIARDAVRMVCPGIACGMIAASWGAWMLRQVVAFVPWYDVVSFTLAPLVLLVAGVTAALLPARKAAMVDPALALREL